MAAALLSAAMILQLSRFTAGHAIAIHSAKASNGMVAPTRREFVNPFAASASTATTGWALKDPDETYAVARDICPGLTPAQLAVQAMSHDPEESRSAIDQLRGMGQAGLDALNRAKQSATNAPNRN